MPEHSSMTESIILFLGQLINEERFLVRSLWRFNDTLPIINFNTSRAPDKLCLSAFWNIPAGPDFIP